MTKLNRNLFAGLIMAIVVPVSCQKEITFENADTDTTVPTNSGNFTAKIDGVSFNANSIKTAHIEAGVIVLYGKSSDKKEMLFSVADSGVHNYVFTTQSLTNVGTYTDSTITPVAAFATNQWQTDSTYGNLNITAIDTAHKTISGTFKMKVYRQLDNLKRTITEGVFTNISYSTITANPQAATDTFRVKVAGTNFAYTTLFTFRSFGMISISASNPGGSPTVGITVPENATTGTRPFDIFEYIGQYNQSSTVMLSADTGHITILEHNTTTKRIRGYFNFLANQTFTHLPPNITLTDGYFSVRYN